MTDEKHPPEYYMVLFIGEARNGISSSALKQSMVKTFKISIARIDKLFVGRPVIIKNNVEQGIAQQYRDILKELGAVCWIEPMPSFYRQYVDRRKNRRTRRSGMRNERRSGSRTRMGEDRRAVRGRRYHDH